MSPSIKQLTIFLLLTQLGLGCASSVKKQETATDSNYQGLGKDSLPPEIVQKFAAQPLPPELSRKIQSMLDVRAPGAGLLHPNKKDLFFTWRVTGSTQIWKLQGPKTFPIQMTGGEDSTAVMDVTPNGKWLIVSRDRSGEENPGLYLQSTEGGALIPIQHKEKVQTMFGFVSSDSQWIYFRANDVTPESYAIYRYNIKSKIKELLFSEKGYWVIIDYKDDGSLLLQKAISNTASEIFEWKPKSKKLIPLLGQGEKEEYDVKFGVRDGEYFVQTNKFGNFRRLYLYEGQKWKAISTEMKHDVSGFAIDDGRKHLVYSINDNGYTKIKALDPRTLREIRLPQFPEAEHVIAGASTRDGKMIMLAISTAKAPKQSFSYNWSTGQLIQWVLPSSPEIDTAKFVSAKLEYYKTKASANNSAVDIPYFVRRPLACQAVQTSCPVIVNFHGGPESQAYPGFSTYAQIFVNEGFIFVEPNVRGSDGYGKEWLHSDDGPKRLNVISDIAEISEHIRKNWSKNGQAPKIGVMGGSYGGYSTLIAMTKFAGSFDAGVATVGMSNLKTFLNNTAPYRRALRIAEYGDPVVDSAALDQLSATTYLDQIKGPLLLIQGVSDPRVPAGEAVQMYDKMKAKKLDAGLILFADEGHGSSKRSNQVLEIGHTIEFFKKNL